MYSDAVKQQEIITNNGNGFHKTGNTNKGVEVFDKWSDWHASEISHHGRMCCEIAREWITATDFSELGGSVYTGPRWLRQKFNWGASSFPIYWCEAVRRKILDCGALAALAHEVFKARGVKSYRVQMVQRFSKVATNQWTNSWNERGGNEPLRWTQDDLIYHEGCAIAPTGNELKIWDASAGWWIDPNSKDGYGALLAIRLSSYDLPSGVNFSWGKHTVNAYQWTRIN
jgi:hypothetical protein